MLPGTRSLLLLVEVELCALFRNFATVYFVHFVLKCPKGGHSRYETDMDGLRYFII